MTSTWFDAFAAARPDDPGVSSADSESSDSSRRRIPSGVLIAVLIAAIVAGVAFVVTGMTQTPAAAPLPPVAFSQDPGQVPDLAGGPLPSIGAPPAGHSRSPEAAGPGVSTATGSAAVAGPVARSEDVVPAPTGPPGQAAPATPGGGRHAQNLVDPLQDNELVIPALGIRAGVETTGIDAGELVIPGDVDQVTAWDGSAPLSGGTGTVLIAGHVDNADQGAGALHDLYLAQPGDVIYLTGGGVVTRWKITGLQAVPKPDLPAVELFTGAAGPRLLRLVTCGGTVHDGSYDQNVIATATPF